MRAHEGLRHYLHQNAARDNLLPYLPLPGLKTPQRGETCKLAALANAMNQEATKKNLTSIPLYKNKRHAQPSLRKLAKANGSLWSKCTPSSL